MGIGITLRKELHEPLLCGGTPAPSSLFDIVEEDRGRVQGCGVERDRKR